MGIIKKLDPHVANLIAAGEVVERPGSVVKELLENSIDAGATAVTVEIRGGGMTYIRVTDNGSGMSGDDAQSAFLRHATSKLRDERGLEAIGTLGFRGEALAAVSAVSKIELLTCEKGENEGTRVVIEGGELISRTPAGCPEGTTMTVRDLFYNTPARLKFIKNDRSEAANVSVVVLRCALSHPEVSIKYIKDGKEECHTPGDGRTESCIYSALGREFASGMMEAETVDEDVTVRGFVCSPYAARGNRAYQFFFVNGRFIKSRTLQAALEQAYRNSLFNGKFPSCVLYIELSNAAVDVNVHPTKMEVKFFNEKRIFDGVYYAVKGALESGGKRAEVELSPSTKKIISAAPAVEAAAPVSADAQKPAQKENFYKSITSDDYKAAYSDKFGGFRTISAAPDRPMQVNDFARTEIKTAYQQTFITPEPAAKPIETPVVNIQIPAENQAAQDKIACEEQVHIQADAAPSVRVVGEAMTTYIIAEFEDTLLIIDKHAAHERIIFDRLKAENRREMTQMLIAPCVFSVSEEEMSIIEENSAVFEEAGFDVSDFGTGRAAVREVPADMDEAEIPSAIQEICEKIAISGKTGREDIIDQILHTTACKAAIKAGRNSQPRELEKIAAAVASGAVKYCPHGRPVAIELSKKTLDKNFKRIV